MIKKNLIPAFIYSCLFILAIFIFVLILWIYTPTNVLNTKQPYPFPVEVHTFNPKTDQIRIIVLHLNYCKNITARGQVTEKLISNTSIVLLPTGDDTMPVGCHDIEAPVALSPRLSPNTYYIEFDVNYQLNPLKNKEIVLDTQKFELK